MGGGGAHSSDAVPELWNGHRQACRGGFFALQPPLWPAYVASLRRWLKPGGRLFMLFMQTGRRGGPPYDCPIPDMRALFADWIWPDTLEPPLAHPLGGEEQPVVLIAG